MVPIINQGDLDIFFFEVFYCKADAKGRVLLPVALRDQMDPILKNGFYIKKSYYEDCLELYPAHEWERVMRELNQKSRFDEKNLNFIRMYTSGLRRVEVDGSGRLLIPKDLVSMAGISKEVTIAPLGKSLEIWDREKYTEKVSASKKEKRKLAKRVMNLDNGKGSVS
ncbi:division/cell wall cluster transcriptional repressor MraZ [Maribacter sp. 2307ULW6-5]|uniref:division/cell wall cluster transcriptional repressor MraZ n=1 Tax=Maribacter sp. 2307ULW6-5 TaxID=3386275 RepID=UPI0039BCDF81